MSHQNGPAYEGWTNYETYAFTRTYGDELKAHLTEQRNKGRRVREVKDSGMLLLTARIQDFIEDAQFGIDFYDLFYEKGEGPESDVAHDALRNSLLSHAAKRVDIEQIVNEVCWEVYESKEGAMAQ